MSTQPPPPPSHPQQPGPQPSGPPPPDQVFPVPPEQSAPPVNWQPPTGPPQYGQPIYQQPQYGQPTPPSSYQPSPVTRPASMDKAVWAMRAGAVMVAVSQLVDFMLRKEITEATKSWMISMGVPAEFVSQTNAEVSPVALIINIAFGAGLWWWMSVFNGKGRGWARVVAHVFFTIHTLFLLSQVAIPVPALSKVTVIAYWACGLAAIIFIWAKDSRRFYAECSRQL
ncbi:hypothetical protein SAMN05421595_2352 [Austwickia chelonae]|uniref:Uncharacterized protein n=1 Tax=Austwickia chelonae NBRC 105200 TaxID=1184607 RepID=K6V8Z7_9MICO|nr:hypothetical protein [Austwickia chelonae]GAB78698.1 hypothetical protein AUCHE_16_01180 [Austwickia chelonae NBRC 105200]SEW34810.1 hypothetical protein SAMN05421595_2352 [Austwickia chelonae]